MPGPVGLHSESINTLFLAQVLGGASLALKTDQERTAFHHLVGAVTRNCDRAFGAMVAEAAADAYANQDG
jgi:hypothetical protein